MCQEITFWRKRQIWRHFPYPAANQVVRPRRTPRLRGKKARWFHFATNLKKYFRAYLAMNKTLISELINSCKKIYKKCFARIAKNE